MVIFCVQILHCTRDEITGEWVLATENSQQCYDSRHLPAFLVALLMLIGYCGMIPMYFWHILWKNMGQLQEKQFRHRWGFLYRDLRHPWYWWKLTTYFVSFLIALEITIVKNNVSLTIGLAVAIVAISAGFVLAFQPFDTRLENLYTFVAAAGKIMSFAILFFIQGNNIGGVCVLVVCFILIIFSTFFINRIPEETTKNKKKIADETNDMEMTTRGEGETEKEKSKSSNKPAPSPSVVGEWTPNPIANTTGYTQMDDIPSPTNVPGGVPVDGQIIPTPMNAQLMVPGYILVPAMVPAGAPILPSMHQPTSSLSPPSIVDASQSRPATPSATPRNINMTLESPGEPPRNINGVNIPTPHPNAVNDDSDSDQSDDN